MIDNILKFAPSIKTLFVKSSKHGAKTGTLKNGVKVVKMQADVKRSQSAPKTVGKTSLAE
jgi:hypothetical protein